ncbi:2-oxoglutarate dehydrogenase, E2 component, dihydrolipoamide succinyltransferase [Kineococcus rubinsiae]|uniref:2-oxoglutarate dehydrogenase, E2 component, dihydrolipoamide succinyltransferase n=1 Tax=Kineococcus rubinsiae TaxID=2609562 RepID=UPI00142FB488|nr:2-oxoglutarate dehydrogenase, E2 component, dihydrolipoamide succinyltransferase [Kineococcus rubinsiae]
MSNSVQMPALGESVTEGTVTRWLKQVGDTVEVDEPLLEVSTDKVDTEIPSPFAGTLQEILVEEDETVEVGADLARIGDGAAPEAAAPSEPEPEPEAAPEPPTTQDAQQAPETEQEPSPEQPPAAAAAPSSGGGTAVKMPALGESVTEGTVTRWLKAVGDAVEVDEPLLEVSTDKVDTEIPSPVAGTLQEILVGEDETVEVGTDLARIGDGAAQPSAPQESAPQESAPQQSAPQESAPAAVPAPEAQDEPKAEETLADEVAVRDSAREQAEQATQPSAQPTQVQEEKASASSSPAPAPQAGEAPAAQPTGGTTYVTPLVRKLAKDLGVDLSALTGTGVGGRIRKQDVTAAAEEAKAAAAKAAEAAKAQQAAPAPAAAPAAKPSAPVVEVSAKRGTTEKMSRLRKIIAQRMVESLQTSAQLTTVIEVDVTRVARLRAQAKNSFQATEGAKLTFLPFFIKATVEALKQHPSLNSSIDGDTVVYHASENISMAVDTPKGLIVPVIKDAGDLNLGGIARKVGDLAARTRANKITPDDLAGGTFTITNTGSIGALFDTPIINQPQVAILGTGAIVKRPVVVADADGQDSIAIRSMAYLALSYDHRIVDGADAARFLQTIKKRIEDGAFEGDLGL